MLSQFKNLSKNQDLFTIITIILVALICFGIGRLTAPKTEPIQIRGLEQASIEEINPEQKQGTTQGDNQGESQGEIKGAVVGSKNSDKYHLPDCPGAKQISEQNKIWFASIEEAKKAGYKPAGNCPGLINK